MPKPTGWVDSSWPMAEPLSSMKLPMCLPPSNESSSEVLETGEFERVGSSKTRHVSVRILSATNSDLIDEVAQGRFRQDLLFRLNTIEIHLPPVGIDGRTFPILASIFLRQHAQHYRKKIGGFEDEALNLFVQFPWPGNIRELDHSIERSVLMAKGERIRVTGPGLRCSK